jgi:hypothetical protein
MTTDTPRTDAAAFSSKSPLALMKTSQQLERELAESKAEVEILKEQARVGNVALDNLRGEVDLWFKRFVNAARQLDSLNPQA